MSRERQAVRTLDTHGIDVKETLLPFSVISPGDQYVQRNRLCLHA